MRVGALGALAGALSLLLAPVAVHAQDANYWSMAFGTRARLLGGVVTGSSGDISSVYYNPGALALTPSAELLLAGSAYQYQRVEVKGGSGVTRDITSSTLGAVPSLFAGEIPRDKTNRIAYSFLTRQQANLEIDFRATTGVGASSPLPNPSFAALEFQLHQNMSENWFGLTWSRLISPALGVGISPYAVVRTQSTLVSFLSQGQNSSGQAALLSYDRDFNFINWRLLAKIGLSGVKDSLTYGLTLTTPGVSLFGGGAVHYNTSLIDQTGSVGNIVGASYQEDLKATYKSPAGAGIGASYGWGSSRIHAAAEWFAAQSQFTVLPTASFTISTPGGDSTVTPIVTERLNSVFNFGFGLEHDFNPILAGFASYHTDRSARDVGQEPGASITSWNLNHVTIGATLHAWRSDFAFGLTTAFGSQAAPALPARPDGKPTPTGAQVHELITTASLGWKITF